MNFCWNLWRIPAGITEKKNFDELLEELLKKSIWKFSIEFLEKSLWKPLEESVKKYLYLLLKETLEDFFCGPQPSCKIQLWHAKTASLKTTVLKEPLIHI